MQIAAANAQLRVYYRGVVKREIAIARGCAVVVHEFERHLGDGFGKFFRIRNGCRAADELWLRTVKIADALQPAQDVCKVASVDAAIIVQLVDDEILQVLKQLHPFGVVGQNTRVQHVGIRHHDVGFVPYRAPGILRRVAIVGVARNGASHGLIQALHFQTLVFSQRFRRKQIQCAGCRICQDAVNHWQVVAKRFAAGSRA